ncbi:MAG TPA: helix-turn-helix domain-containing protein [Smithellaceae bacterium]|nr:helix-turn-helix domain-containing protein [Smithellaceae bacterium]
MENELLTVKEMAAKIKTPVSWLYSRTRETGDGTIPRIKIGKYLRFNEQEVMAWIKEKYGNVAQ